ncbi:MAG TPA: DUF4388 domain-containing protein [bacterium]|nr:DUF4388 domain-containing protein [bacterium]
MAESPAKESYVKGSLTQVPFPKVLNFINQAGKTGILALSHGKRKVHIHCDRGEIVYVTSSYFPDLTLGEFLLKDKKITMQVQEESIDKAKASKIKQGAYLVERGYLSPHDLYEALNTQVTEKLFKLFTWGEGDFFFREGEIVPEEHRILNISFPNLLYRGIRSYMQMNRPPVEFRGRKESPLAKRLAGRYKIEDLRLGPTETRIYNLINGQRTLRQIVSLANMNKRAAYKVLYGLYLLELIGFPEATKTDEFKLQTKKSKPTKKEKDGFEVSISDDLIKEAMQSVDRIKQEVADMGDEADISIEMLAEQTRARAKSAKPVSDADEFAAKVDETLGGEAPAETAAKPTFASEPEEAVDLEAPTERDPFAAAGGDDFGGDDLSVEPETDAGLGEEEVGWESEDFGSDGGFGEPEEEEPAEDYFMDIEDYTNPEDLIKQAVFLIEEERWGDAVRFMQKAIELDENNPDSYALLGWCQFNDQGGINIAEAEATIKKGLRLDSTRYMPYLYLGKLYAASNQYEFAELHFVKALELNVECSEAKEEIKRIYSR